MTRNNEKELICLSHFLISNFLFPIYVRSDPYNMETVLEEVGGGKGVKGEG
jgi:hypothetical protein